MYHYVRFPCSDLPHFAFLHRDAFAKQLRWIELEFGFVPQQDFLEWLSDPASVRKPSGVVLTFDDGLIDHYEFVAPLLADFRTWGIFYVPTQPLISRKMLNVHRAHVLLGFLSGTRCLELLELLVTEEMFEPECFLKYSSTTYTRQASTSEATKHFKRIINYYIDSKFQTHLLDQMVSTAMDSSVWATLTQDFYVTPTMLRSLRGAGNLIGSHSDTHRLLSNLPGDEQKREIEISLSKLRKIMKEPVRTFCHPYGGFHSFTEETERLLSEAGVQFSFNVEQRDISVHDVLSRPHALPRYDCNFFPHGQQ
jgi:peptidoglycan/xylan/chitin deacetylase (PgdA/CDA1 family)